MWELPGVDWEYVSLEGEYRMMRREEGNVLPPGRHLPHRNYQPESDGTFHQGEAGSPGSETIFVRDRPPAVRLRLQTGSRPGKGV